MLRVFVSFCLFFAYLNDSFAAKTTCSLSVVKSETAAETSPLAKLKVALSSPKLPNVIKDLMREHIEYDEGKVRVGDEKFKGKKLTRQVLPKEPSHPWHHRFQIIVEGSGGPGATSGSLSEIAELATMSDVSFILLVNSAALEDRWKVLKEK